MEDFRKEHQNGENMQEESEKEVNQKRYVERKRWVFFGLPFTFTKYTVTNEIITIDEGFLSTKENDCYMYKVQDVELLTSLGERIFNLGTVACYTGDNTHPQLHLSHIRNAKEIKDYILRTSEEARRRRRTLNTLDIGAVEVDGMDS